MGGPESAEKRDFLAGYVPDLWDERRDTDEEDVEEVLWQYMQDEYELLLEDDSENLVAKDIMRLRNDLAANDSALYDRLIHAWNISKGKETSTKGLQIVEHNQDVDPDEADSIDEESEEDDDEDEDVDMDDAPALVPAKEKPSPEVDDEGFTKVAGKKKR